MIGDNQVYEPSFISLKDKLDNRRVSVDEKCRVAARAAMGTQSVGTMRKSRAKIERQKNGYNLLINGKLTG